MKPSVWKSLSPEEKKRLRKEQGARKSRREKQRLERARQKDLRDERSKMLKPGDYVKFRPMYCPVVYANKVALILAWNDDGQNEKRAPRNKRVVFAIEPHLHENIEDCETYKGKLQEVLPLTAMELIAEVSR